MSRLHSIVIAVLTRLNKRMAYAALVAVVLSFLIQVPNSLTHTCVPTVRTQMGLSSEGYPYERHFCNEGYYPELKWGLEEVYNNTLIQIFLVLVPLSLLIPMAVIVIGALLPKSAHSEPDNRLPPGVQMIDQHIRSGKKEPTDKS